MGLEIFLKDRAKEMIFPVTLGEGEKDTNTEHAGAIASTCTKRRHEQGSFFTAGCPVDLKSHPLCVYHTQEIKEFEMSCKLDLKKNKKRCLWSTTNEGPTSCVQPHAALFCFSTVCEMALFIFQTRGKCWEHRTFLHRPIYRQGATSHPKGLESVAFVCVCVRVWEREFRCSCSAVDVYKWVAPRAIWQSRLTPHRHTTEKASECVCVCKHFCLPLLLSRHLHWRRWV